MVAPWAANYGGTAHDKHDGKCVPCNSALQLQGLAELEASHQWGLRALRRCSAGSFGDGGCGGKTAIVFNREAL